MSDGFKMVRDVSNDFRMPRDDSAAILADGTGRYWVAWGRACDAMLAGGTYEPEPTAEHGSVGPFDTLEDAEDQVTVVRVCHKALDLTRRPRKGPGAP